MAGLAVTAQFRGIEIWLKKSGKYSKRKRKKIKLSCKYTCMHVCTSPPLLLSSCACTKLKEDGRKIRNIPFCTLQISFINIRKTPAVL